MIKYAYFAGGCFWCITPVFNEHEGVLDVVSGYSGGDTDYPTYEDVKHQLTDHRETIMIKYDDSLIDFPTLLGLFCDNVDPFDEGGQFIDRGHSYTLAIYYQDEYEKTSTLDLIKKIETQTQRKVFIACEPFKSFWDAEEYHQMYYLKNPEEFKKELVESGRKKA